MKINVLCTTNMAFPGKMLPKHDFGMRILRPRAINLDNNPCRCSTNLLLQNRFEIELFSQITYSWKRFYKEVEQQMRL